MPPIRIAIVEDELDYSKTLATLVGSTPGFECVGAVASIAEAVQKLPPIAPHVVLVDLRLADGDGIQCIRELRQVCPSTKPLVLSKFDEPARIFDAIVAGAYGYLLKTDGLRRMLDAVEAVMNGQGAMSPSIARRAMELLRKQARPEVEDDESLTPKETEVLDLVRQGLTSKEVADRLSMSHHTVANHLTRIYKKLHINRRSDLPGYKGRSAGQG